MHKGDALLIPTGTRHQIANFTGVSAPYEAPEEPEIVVQTDKQTVNECVAHIIDFLKTQYIETDWSI